MNYDPIITELKKRYFFLADKESASPNVTDELDAVELCIAILREINKPLADIGPAISTPRKINDGDGNAPVLASR